MRLPVGTRIRCNHCAKKPEPGISWAKYALGTIANPFGRDREHGGLSADAAVGTLLNTGFYWVEFDQPQAGGNRYYFVGPHQAEPL
jgi:hypothetical protein